MKTKQKQQKVVQQEIRRKTLKHHGLVFVQFYLSLHDEVLLCRRFKY